MSPPLPLAVRARRLSLDGSWEVQLEPGAKAQPIVVPFTFESELSGIGLGHEIHERLRYRRIFTIPDAWAGSHVLLHFSGVDWHARVALDGTQVGEHSGGYAHFCVDLGPVTGEHELLVDVDDLAEGPQPRGKQRGSGGIWYTRATGIWRPVWIEAAPAAHITRFDVEAGVDGELRARVETSEPVDVELRVDGQRVTFRGETSLRVDEPRLWSPEHPELYDVEIETASGDRHHHVRRVPLGRAPGGEVMLNGEPELPPRRARPGGTGRTASTPRPTDAALPVRMSRRCKALASTSRACA